MRYISFVLRGVSYATLAVGVSAAASAETLEEVAASFGIRQTVLDISLSPSGDKIAYIGAGPGHSEILNVVDLTAPTEPKPILHISEPESDLGNCDWATDTRLVCSVYSTGKLAGGALIGMSRVFAVDENGENAIMLTPRQSFRALGFRQDGGSVVSLDAPGTDDRILMTKEFVPERTIGTRLANEEAGLGVEEVDVTDGKRKLVERPDKDAIAYVADQNGQIRMKIRHPSDGRGILGERQLFYYRDSESDRWRELSEIKVDAQSRSGFRPVAIDSNREVAYGFETVGGFDALAELPLTEQAKSKVIMSRDDVDVDSLIRIGRQKRVVGASYATEKRAIEYFDTSLAALANALHRALPGQPLINIIGASADESKLLIVASSDTDPGMVYLYDKATNELGELLPVRNYLSGREMGKMQPVEFPASDGTMIPGYLTLPPGAEGANLPAIVLPHGGPSARDEWGFDWLVQFFAARGYAVLQPNYRGSSGYGAAWFGRNGFQAWRTAVGDVNDAGRWLVTQGIADADKLAVAGWSYGGYAALQSQILDPDLYKAVVAIAPVTDLEQLREDARPYTSFSLVDAFIGRGEHVEAGSPARHAGQFDAPVLLLHGTLDQNVDVRHSQLMEKRLDQAGKNVTYVEFEEQDHSLSDSSVRTEMLMQIDKFLKAALQ